MKLSTLDQVQKASYDFQHAKKLAALARKETPGKLFVKLIDTRPGALADKHYDVKDEDLLNRLREVIAEWYEGDAMVSRETLYQLGVDPEA